jgi:beta-galactosidase
MDGVAASPVHAGAAISLRVRSRPAFDLPQQPGAGFFLYSSPPAFFRQRQLIMFRMFSPAPLLRLAFLLLLALAAMRVHASPSPREVVPLNRAWTFTLGDPAGAQAPAYDDSRWQVAHLPHSFSIPYFLGKGFYVGYGWYRKTVPVPAAWQGKRVSLEFDGVFQDAEIYVNGKRAGRHRGGYTGFSIDITAQVHPGPNTIAVRVNNRWDATLAPRAGEHVFSGGIYRDVRLVVTDPVHVTWYGTFVRTPEVDAARATLALETEVSNATARDQVVSLRSRVLDPHGILVTRISTATTIRAGATATIAQTPPPVVRPSLWGPHNPALYRLVSEVYVGARLVDVFTTPFGVRSIAWTADRGFFLNGEHLYLRGANVHQDHAGWGDAVTDGAARRDVRMIRDAGFNFIRGSHYPHSPAFTTATDELGILFWSEAPFWGIGGFGADPGWMSSAYPPDPKDRAAFEESVLAQSAEMIRIHRNHPSVVVWSNGNETFFTAPGAMAALRDFTRRQVAAMKALDPSRPVAVGGAQRGGIDKLGDVAGYNGDGATLFVQPGVASIVSEYGSTIAVRPGAYAPGWGDLPELPGQQGKSGPYAWRYPWRSGEAIWAGFDHGSIAAVEFGEMGMIDYFRIPKRQYYWYRNEYAGVPPPPWPVAGTPSRLALRANQTAIAGTDGHDDIHLDVVVQDDRGRALSNSPDVTLTIERGPGEFPTGRAITFRNDSPVAIRDGQAAIEFRSYYAATTRIRATSPGLRDAVLDVTTTGPDPYIEGESPVAGARPVVAYPAASIKVVDTAPINVSLDRPTSSSASAPGSSPRLANDGDGKTGWEASPGTDATWSVDLENLYDLRGIGIDGLPAGAAPVVETSLDRDHWTAVGGLRYRQESYGVDIRPGAIRARFVRVRVKAAGEGGTVIREVRVFAVPAA